MRYAQLLTAATLALAAAPTHGQIWTQVDTPTTQDLNGVVVSPDRALAVGNGGVILGSAGGPWGLVDSGTGNDLFDVDYDPATGRFVVSGRDVVLEGDGTNTFTPIVETSTGQIYTPVLTTSEEDWYGQPSFAIFGFSFLNRRERATGTTLGKVVTAPVLALCAVPGADLIRYVTTSGDVTEMTDDLNETVLVDQSSVAPLNLVNGGFSEDCRQIVAAHQVLATLFNFMFLDLEPARASVGLEELATERGNSSPWEKKAIAELGFDIAAEDGSVFHRGGTIRVYVREEDGERELYQTIDCTTWKQATIDPPLQKGIFDLDSAPAPSAWAPSKQSGATRTPRLLAGAVDAIRLVAVGQEGAVLEAMELLPFFADGFESGDESAWSAATGD